MTIPGVLEWQRALRKIGYMVESTGTYDQKTYRETLRFQKDFGLLADGMAGPRTRALLYQMVK
jgi:murein L,D-transpeptidase YcbB/YkuD